MIGFIIGWLLGLLIIGFVRALFIVALIIFDAMYKPKASKTPSVQCYEVQSADIDCN